MRDLMDDRRLVHVLRLDADAQHAPLDGWPYRYAAWVPDYLGRLRAARASRRANSVKAAQAKGARHARRR